MTSSADDRSPSTVASDPSASDCFAALADMRSGIDECERQLGERLDELEALREMLVRQEAQLTQREQQLAAAEAANFERSRKIEQARGAAEQSLLQVHDEAQRLAEARATFNEQRQQNNDAERNSERSSHSAGSRKQNRDWDRERLQLTAELKAAQEQVGLLSQAALELAAARKETAELRKQLLLQQQRLIHARGHFQANPLHQLRRLETERDCLSHELSEAQRQLREMHEDRLRAERRANAERLSWSAALEKMRETIALPAAGSSPVAEKRPSKDATLRGADDLQATRLAALLSSIQQMQHELTHAAGQEHTALENAELSSLA